MKKVSFRIRRTYFFAIVKGTKTEELRSDIPFWRKRLLGDDPPEIAVFVCGKDVHRRHINRIYVEEPEKVLGRPLSSQGRQDIYTDNVIVIELGDEYIEDDQE